MTTTTAVPHISQLREHLMETLAALRDRTNPMEPDQARAIAQVAGVLVDTAKVEVDYLKVTGQDRSGFIEEPPQITSDASGSGVPGYSQGVIEQFPGGRRHRIKG